MGGIKWWRKRRKPSGVCWRVSLCIVCVCVCIILLGRRRRREEEEEGDCCYCTWPHFHQLDVG